MDPSGCNMCLRIVCIMQRAGLIDGDGQYARIQGRRTRRDLIRGHTRDATRRFDVVSSSDSVQSS